MGGLPRAAPVQLHCLVSLRMSRRMRLVSSMLIDLKSSLAIRLRKIWTISSWVAKRSQKINVLLLGSEIGQRPIDGSPRLFGCVVRLNADSKNWRSVWLRWKRWRPKSGLYCSPETR